MIFNNNKKDINVGEVNEVLSISKKLLKFTYNILIIGLILCIFLFCKSFGIFNFLLTFLNILSPLFIGFIIAWLFNPLVEKITKKGVNRFLASIIVYIIIILFLFCFIKIFIPVIYKQINDFIGLLPGILTSISKWVTDFFERLSVNGMDLTSTKDSILSNLTSLITSTVTSLPSNVFNIMVNLFSGLGTLAIGFVIGLYMLFDFDKLTNYLANLLPGKYRVETYELLNNIGIEVRKCVNGTLLVALMVFVCDSIGFSIIGLDGAILFGLFCGITDLIPYIGPYVGGGVAALIGFTQSPVIGVGTVIIAIIVQLIENYILQPVVMSRATQLNPIVVMLGLLVFGHFFGIVGMVLAMPCLSIMKVILNFINKKTHLFEYDDEIEEDAAEAKEKVNG